MDLRIENATAQTRWRADIIRRLDPKHKIIAQGVAGTLDTLPSATHNEWTSAARTPPHKRAGAPISFDASTRSTRSSRRVWLELWIPCPRPHTMNGPQQPERHRTNALARRYHSTPRPEAQDHRAGCGWNFGYPALGHTQ